MNDLTGKIRSLDDLSDVQADSVAREVVAFAAGMIFSTAKTVVLTWDGTDEAWVIEHVLDQNGDPLESRFSMEPEDTLGDVVDLVSPHLYRSVTDTLRIEVRR